MNTMGLQRRHLLGLAACWAGTVRAQVDLADAINMAGRQRMLSQRMVKAWLALAAQAPAPTAQQVLSQSMALFERQHEQLKAYAPSTPIRNTYAALDPAWQALREGLSAAPGQARAAALLQADAQILSLAQQGTTQLEATSTRPAGPLVNLAGRQRMLSQRLAKFYLAGVLQIDPSTVTTEMARARNDFLQAQDTLRKAPETSARITEELALADGQWVFFDAALKKIGSATPGSKPLSEVFVASENLLSVMDRITGLYAALKA